MPSKPRRRAALVVAVRIASSADRPAECIISISAPIGSTEPPDESVPDTRPTPSSWASFAAALSFGR